MKVSSATPVTFYRHKYGQPLAIDASSFPRWTGIVPDGEAHVLDFHEFLVVSSGTAEVSIGDDHMRVAGPAVLFTPPGVVRRVAIVEPLALQLVVFSDDALGHANWCCAPGFSAGALGIHDRRALRSLNSVAQLMAVELASPRPDSAVMLDALLAQFVITLNRSRADVTGEVPRLVRRFEELLDAGFRDRHDVAAYAAALGVSGDHLSAVTRAHAGVSAKAMIDRRLFDEAARLLIGTSQPVAAIGAALGFDEPAQFSRAFKRACGQSPSRFRDGR